MAKPLNVVHHIVRPKYAPPHLMARCEMQCFIYRGCIFFWFCLCSFSSVQFIFIYGLSQQCLPKALYIACAVVHDYTIYTEPYMKQEKGEDKKTEWNNERKKTRLHDEKYQPLSGTGTWKQKGCG